MNPDSLAQTRCPRLVDKLIPQVGVVNVDLEGRGARWGAGGGCPAIDDAVRGGTLSTFFLSFSTMVGIGASGGTAGNASLFNRIEIFFTQ